MLILGIGGFRPGVILGPKVNDGLKYSDVQLTLIRDDAGAKPGATIVIKQNRRISNTVYENQSNRQADSSTLGYT